jgi:hypothetical protein
MEDERGAHAVAQRQLQALLEAQTRLRRVAEAQAREVRRELERLAEAVCPEEVDRLRRRSPEGLSALPPRRIAEMVLAAVGPRRQAAVPMEGGPARRWAEAEARLAGLEARLRAAEERAARAEAEAALLRQRLQGVRAAPAPEAGPLQARHGSGRWEMVRAAADLLAAAGYEVDPMPEPLPIPGGGAFLPDLTVRLKAGVLPVEVEDLSRPRPEREARWEACYALGDGHLCFVAPDPRMLDRLRSEVFFWAGARPLVLWMTDLERGHGRRGESVWMVRRG